MQSYINQIQKVTYCMIPLNKIHRIGKSRVREQISGFQGMGERENGKWQFNGCVLERWKSVENRERLWLHNTANTLSATECTLKWSVAYYVNFTSITHTHTHTYSYSLTSACTQTWIRFSAPISSFRHFYLLEKCTIVEKICLLFWNYGLKM